MDIQQNPYQDKLNNLRLNLKRLRSVRANIEDEIDEVMARIHDVKRMAHQEGVDVS